MQRHPKPSLLEYLHRGFSKSSRQQPCSKCRLAQSIGSDANQISPYALAVYRNSIWNLHVSLLPPLAIKGFSELSVRQTEKLIPIIIDYAVHAGLHVVFAVVPGRLLQTGHPLRSKAGQAESCLIGRRCQLRFNQIWTTRPDRNDSSTLNVTSAAL
jgi:hypothetical protein